MNPKCPYYLHNLKKVDKKHLDEDYGKNRYKLHYINREFTIDFFKLDLNSLSKNASSLKFTKFDSNTMSLCLTLHVNLGLSLRKTKQALNDLYSMDISHQSIANYCKSAAACIKPFIDNYDLALWVAYYNFLRPHKHHNYKVLNDVEMLRGVGNMLGKWPLLIFLGQQTILNMQKQATA